MTASRQCHSVLPRCAEWTIEVCNRYASDIRKAGLEREVYGFDEWSETRINTILEVFPKSFAPVIRTLPDGTRERHKMRWGLPGPRPARRRWRAESLVISYNESLAKQTGNSMA